MRSRLLAGIALVLSAASAAPLGGCSSPPGGSATSDDASPPPPTDDAGGAPATGTPGAPPGAPPGDDAAAPPDAADGAPPPPPGDGALSPDAPPPPASAARVVAYLPNYSGSYADWAKSIDFTKMTHLNLAFATANGSNAWDMGASDADVKALVDAAHAAGTKVLASLGGGGGDQSVIAQYKDPANIPPLVASLDTFVSAHGLDGVYIDIEDPANLGAGYSSFVDAVVATLRPEGKLVTAAVAQYLQDSMADATLHELDFINVMIYSSYADSVAAMTYYTGTKGVPKARVTLGAGFFGTDGSGNEYAYADILAADGSAWSRDSAQVKGQTVNYTGVASMQKLAQYSKGFGGLMFWELSEDAPGAHSLYEAIQGAM